MLDIKFIRENPEKIKEGAKNKGVNVDVDEILQLDKEVSVLLTARQKLQEERNRAAKEKDIEKGKKIKTELEELEDEFGPLSTKLEELLLQIPNLPKDDVKVGKDESENEIIKTVGKVPEFDFTPKDHLDLGEALDIIDVQRASKASGARFYYLKNEGALLEFALLEFALDTLLEEKFTPIIPPALIKTDTMKKLGYMENGGAEDMFHLEKDGLTLVGTAEHSLVSMHMDETFNENELPKRYVGFSPSFRREAGSYGKDTRGILRVHQFDKVEMVSFVKNGQDEKEHDYLLSIEEKLFQALDISYQVVKMCTGDLGFPAARKYDIEAWMPGQNKYREVTSVSTVTDFQSRRLNTKYKTEGGTHFVNILNGTAFSMTRPIIAILENYQEKDGSIRIPEVLQKYMRGIKKIERKLAI
jgi:seryl-tRNA synthetase